MHGAAAHCALCISAKCNKSRCRMPTIYILVLYGLLPDKTNDECLHGWSSNDVRSSMNYECMERCLLHGRVECRWLTRPCIMHGRHIHNSFSACISLSALSGAYMCDNTETKPKTVLGSAAFYVAHPCSFSHATLTYTRQSLLWLFRHILCVYRTQFCFSFDAVLSHV